MKEGCKVADGGTDGCHPQTIPNRTAVHETVSLYLRPRYRWLRRCLTFVAYGYEWVDSLYPLEEQIGLDVEPLCQLFGDLPAYSPLAAQDFGDSALRRNVS